jgi:hypothetical protein
LIHQKFLNITTFCYHNTTHTNQQPQPTTCRSNIHPRRGDIAISRWEMYCNIIMCTTFQTHLFFWVILQVSTSPITMPPTLTLWPTRWLGSQMYSMEMCKIEFEGKKSSRRQFIVVNCIKEIYFTHLQLILSLGT